jgi:hypothetical protein
MATAEHPMWVTKRYAALRNQQGFVMVPDALRAALIADGGAMDTFNHTSFKDNSPLGPAITALNFTPAAVAVDSPVGTTAGTLAAVGGTAPFTYFLPGDDAGNFAVDGATVKTAVTPLTEGAHALRATVADSGGRQMVSPALTVTVTAAAPPLARTATRARK